MILALTLLTVILAALAWWEHQRYCRLAELSRTWVGQIQVYAGDNAELDRQLAQAQTCIELLNVELRRRGDELARLQARKPARGPDGRFVRRS